MNKKLLIIIIVLGLVVSGCGSPAQTLSEEPIMVSICGDPINDLTIGEGIVKVVHLGSNYREYDNISEGDKVVMMEGEDFLFIDDEGRYYLREGICKPTKASIKNNWVIEFE